MNTSHYPSLELCKKLSANSFPKTTEEVMVYKQLSEDFWSHIEPRYMQHTNGSTSRIVCPSVMELLDEMPGSIPDWRNRAFSIWTLVMWKFWWFWWVQYWEWVEEWQTKKYCESKESLPNALAEMWLWLKENKFISTLN